MNPSTQIMFVPVTSYVPVLSYVVPMWPQFGQLAPTAVMAVGQGGNVAPAPALIGWLPVYAPMQVQSAPQPPGRLDGPDGGSENPANQGPVAGGTKSGLGLNQRAGTLDAPDGGSENPANQGGNTGNPKSGLDYNPK